MDIRYITIQIHACAYILSPKHVYMCVYLGREGEGERERERERETERAREREREREKEREGERERERVSTTCRHLWHMRR